MFRNNELYFCLHSTENEHYVIADELKKKCKEFGLQLIYYRELKEGHIPMCREVKIVGAKLWAMENYLRDEKSGPLMNFVMENPHRVKI